MDSSQTIKNKLGEVTFRRKLALQFKEGKTYFPGEPSKKQYKKIIKDRIKDYTKYFTILQKNNILLGPYLELGAGVGQGAMLLENKFGIQGFTSDISFETLQLSTQYKKNLKFKKMPIKICCDLYNLPFQSNSIPFIFTFQTLHHLPDPYPAMKEFKRVLAPGGYFYFNEEPIAQKFNLNLWRRDRNLQWFEKILKYTIVLHFISRIGKSEVDHNILEETFSLKLWEKSLNVFDFITVTMSIFPFNSQIQQTKKQKKDWIYPPFYQKLLLELFGGGIGALCQKKTNGKALKTAMLHELLACPSCKSKPPLEKKENSFYCRVCKSTYKNKNGIYMLLSKKQEQLLYFQ